MAFWFILAILLLGLVLIFLEMFLIPGTTLFGIVGGVALLFGVVLVYMNFGAKWGNISVAVTLALVAVAIIGGFRVIESNKLAMKGEISGKVNELDSSKYSIGDKGVAASELRPNGKAMFNDERIEVYSNGEYIARNSELEIIKITKDKIFVKQVTA